MKISNKLKLIIVLAVICCLGWFCIVSPYLSFLSNEKKLREAVERYFELNPNELPTGERIKTLTLNTLYHKSYLKDDLFIPFTKKTCSIEKSWVKVRRENNDYHYYIYLDCGIFSSRIDHKGPTIKLEGDNTIQIGLGEEFSDPGIKSVIDNVDGKLKIEDVDVNNTVNTAKVGSYEITYTAFDALKNKSVVKRIVNVVQTLHSTVKKDLGEAKNYKGAPENNYVRLSNILFQIYGIDSNKNIVLVAAEDIANVNYTKLDKWLDYFYGVFNDYTKNSIVDTKYCNMSLNDEQLTTTTCSSYSKAKKIGIPSVDQINLAEGELYNFMQPYTMSWTANSKNKTEAYLTRNLFFNEDEGKEYLSYPTKQNFGVRPMMTVKGDLLITGGKGLIDDPYVFGDVKPGKGGELINTRYTGEYISIGGEIYRIIQVEKDGTTKVISDKTIGSLDDKLVCTASPTSPMIVYNPKDKISAAYCINNRASSFVDTSYFVNHEIEVPVYENEIIYGEEVDIAKYKAVLSAPDMYEVFSAQPQLHSNSLSYWLKNMSKSKDRRTGAITDIGVPFDEYIPDYLQFHVRVVGYMKKGSVISSGLGTYESPYIIK